MYLDEKDAKAIDVLLENYQNSAKQDGRDAAAEALKTMREHLPKQGGALDERLVMDIQTVLIPVLESDDPTGPPETIKARIRKIFDAMDSGRSSQ